ncbi:MAG: hypothetical protein JKY54_01755 [Flavobacteriales bacterium]|nr:hypothetical protein [Flavobacteriales bacterium]
MNKNRISYAVLVISLFLYSITGVAQTDSTDVSTNKEVGLNMPLFFVLAGGLVLVLIFLYKMLKKKNPYQDDQETK